MVFALNCWCLKQPMIHPPLHKRRRESIGANLDPFTIGCTKQFRIGLTMARIDLMIMGKLSATTLSMRVVLVFLARHSTNIFIQMNKSVLFLETAHVVKPSYLPTMKLSSPVRFLPIKTAQMTAYQERRQKM